MAKVYGTNNLDVLDGFFDDVTNGDDTIFGYGGDDWINALDGNDILMGGEGADKLNGGDGNDTASYMDSPVGVDVNLATHEGHGGTAEGDYLFSIENLTGSFYDDSLYGDYHDNVLSGSWGDDTLIGGGGADILNGGIGRDTAGYSGSPTGVVISLFWHTASGGDAEGDQLNSIENLRGSAYDDHLLGDNGANTLIGVTGNDTLIGFDGDDILVGDGRLGIGNDTLWGGNDADILVGGFGVDELHGGPGPDTFVWNYVLETGAYDAATLDTISDFNPAESDKIDVQNIDAYEDFGGNQAFTFIGSADFSAPGQIRYFNVGNETYIVLNTDANPDNEAAIHLSGVFAPQTGWFAL